MDKIKTYYREHEKEINYYVGGFLVGAIYVSLKTRKVLKGMEIDSADHFIDSDGSYILAYLKNGGVQKFVKRPAA